MHEKSVSHTQIQDFILCMCVCGGGGGGQACLPETNPDIFKSSTLIFYSYRAEVRVALNSGRYDGFLFYVII